MHRESSNDRLLQHIMVYGFALSFGLVAASLEALRPSSTGFALDMSWWTLLTLALSAVAMVPCFFVIVFSERKILRRFALATVVVLGVGAFFYPLRMVPQETHRAVFVGLAVAAVALSVLATLLVILYRFFEKDAAPLK